MENTARAVYEQNKSGSIGEPQSHTIVPKTRRVETSKRLVTVSRIKQEDG